MKAILGYSLENPSRGGNRSEEHDVAGQTLICRTHPSALLPPLDIRIPIPPRELQARKSPLERLFLCLRRRLGVVDVIAHCRCEELVALTDVGSAEGIGVC